MLNYALARRRREELGLSQTKIAEQLNVTISTVSKWETGDAEPRAIAQLAAWARLLGLEPGELIAENGEPTRAGAAP